LLPLYQFHHSFHHAMQGVNAVFENVFLPTSFCHTRCTMTMSEILLKNMSWNFLLPGSSTSYLTITVGLGDMKRSCEAATGYPHLSLYRCGRKNLQFQLILYKQNQILFLFVVKVTTQKYQMSKFRPKIECTEASYHISVSQKLIINVKGVVSGLRICK